MHTVQDLLKKISYIEADVEIQKQILFSIPSEQKDEIEKVITTIAKAKKEILELREEIERIDPKEFELLTRIDNAVEAFKENISNKNITLLTNKAEDIHCSISCRDGRIIPCLVKACDDAGNWIVIAEDGELIHLSAEMVNC